MARHWPDTDRLSGRSGAQVRGPLGMGFLEGPEPLGRRFPRQLQEGREKMICLSLVTSMIIIFLTLKKTLPPGFVSTMHIRRSLSNSFIAEAPLLSFPFPSVEGLLECLALSSPHSTHLSAPLCCPEGIPPLPSLFQAWEHSALPLCLHTPRPLC